MPKRSIIQGIGEAAAALVAGLLLSGCECGGGPGASDPCDSNPEQCVTPEPVCSEQWAIEVAPGQGPVTQGTELVLSSSLDATTAAQDSARIYYQLDVTAPGEAPVGAVGRYTAPIVLNRPGVATLRARFGCDPEDVYRTSVTMVVTPQAALELSPAPGDYRSRVEVSVRVTSGEGLRVTVRRIAPDDGVQDQDGTLVVIPPDGATYRVEATAVDAFGNVVASIEGDYSSDPYTPEVIDVSTQVYAGRYEVILVTYDRDITGTWGSGMFYRLPSGDRAVTLYPAAPLAAGASVKLSDHLMALGEDATVPRDPQSMLDESLRVCRCDEARASVSYPDYAAHFALSPPVTVAIDSNVALDPDSLDLTVQSYGLVWTVPVLPMDILDQDAEGTQFVISLANAGLLMGGHYALTVQATSTHPLEPVLEAAVEFSTELTGGYSAALAVTEGAGLMLASHALRADATEGWRWFARNPHVVAPRSSEAYSPATMALQDIAGAAATADVPAMYPDQATNAVYRSFASWPTVPVSYLRSWVELAVGASYSGRDPASLVPVSFTVEFDDGRMYRVLQEDRSGPRLQLSLPDGFHDYPATMATVKGTFSLTTAVSAAVSYSVEVTFMLEADSAVPHFDRTSWSWFGLMDTDTAEVDILVAGVSVVYGEAISSVTLAVGSPYPPTTVVFEVSGQLRWSAPSGSRLGTALDVGVFPATLYARNAAAELLDAMQVPLMAAPSRDFVQSLTDTVQGTDDAYVLEWQTGFDPYYAVGLLYLQVFEDESVSCQNPSTPAVQQLIWPADAPQVYVPVAGLNSGMYGVCVTFLAGESYDGAGFTLWQSKRWLDVQ